MSMRQVLDSDHHQDFVQYFVFPPPNCEDPEDLLFRLSAAAQTLTADYVWQKDPFRLRQSSKKLASFDEDADSEDRRDPSCSSDEEPVFFYGLTRFGDNLEDEWFIVYVLRELSKQFPEIVVKVDDNDGEFLLIEAADHLPDWAESDEVCNNRVFICQGFVHLIPPESSSKGNSTAGLRILDGLQILRSGGKKTVASAEIQEAISSRIGAYPEKMRNHFHHVAVMLPPLLAAILKENPNLLGPVVEAFYLRDPISLRGARLMKTCQPKEGLIKRRIRFTRCLYAMLAKQDFRPDTKSGWNLPPVSSSDYKAHILGSKLTTGFEILVNSRRPANNDNPNELRADDPRWLRYVEALRTSGYFKDFMAGSKPYENLLSSAKSFFKANLANGMESDASNTIDEEENASDEVHKLLGKVKIDQILNDKDGSELDGKDDDESWMCIEADDLETMLEKKFQSGGLNPSDIPSKLKEFMTKISDFSGVEPSAQDAAADLSDFNGESNEDDVVEPLDFRADEFVSAMDKLLHDLGAPDKDFHSSEDSYGSDEDELNVDFENIKKMHQFSKESKDFFSIVDKMDKELASTKVGETFQSYKKKSPKPKSTTPSAARSSKGESSTTAKASVQEVDEFDEEEGLTPVNIDMAALANILESYQSQDGPSGPSSNLLQSVGIDLSKMSKKK